MVFGWLHKETKLRRFRTAYIEVPRKNGKSMAKPGQRFTRRRLTASKQRLSLLPRSGWPKHRQILGRESMYSATT
jgi:hypothetical protein